MPAASGEISAGAVTARSGSASAAAPFVPSPSIVDQRLVHDPGVDDQGAVDERGPGISQADDDRATITLGLAASQQTVHDAAMVAGSARVFDDLRTPW